MTYHARIMWSRGEDEFLDLTPYVTTGSWSRKLNTWDEARVKVGPISSVCCDQLMGVRPWLHELWITQDGDTQFVGPVITPAPGNVGQIDARGLAHWFHARFVRNSLNTTGAPIAASAMVRFIIDSALSPSDPNMSNFIDIRDCATPLERKIDATGATSGSGPPLAWDDQLQQILGTYMNMSSFGRRLTFWCAKSKCLTEGPVFGPGDFVSDAPVSFDGETYATRAAVYNGDTTTPIIGYSGGTDPTYGILVERKYQDKTVSSDASAIEGALVHTRKLPQLVAGTQIGDDNSLVINPNSDIKSSRIQVGMCSIVTLTNACQPLGAYMRVEKLDGSWGETGEKTSVTLAEQPALGLSVI